MVGVDVGGTENELAVEGRALLRNLEEELRRLDERVKLFDAQLAATAQRLEPCQRLMAILGIGLQTATALVAAVGDAGEFRNGREMAAWLGLVPRQRSTGERPTHLGISKRGDRYLRTLLIHEARSSLRYACRRTDGRSRWALATEQRRGAKHRGSGPGEQERADRVGAAGTRGGVRHRACREGRVKENVRNARQDGKSAGNL